MKNRYYSNVIVIKLNWQGHSGEGFRQEKRSEKVHFILRVRSWTSTDHNSRGAFRGPIRRNSRSV